jgi:hypothetical protein
MGVPAHAALLAANIKPVSAGTTLVQEGGPYGAEGFVRQAYAPLPNFSNLYPVVGSWLVDHVPCGLSIREDEKPDHGQRLALPAARHYSVARATLAATQRAATTRSRCGAAPPWAWT